MTENMTTLCINATAYCLLLLYYIYKIRSINLGIIVLAIFAISSIGSVWYYSFDVTPVYFPHVNTIPLVYLFVLVWICTKPLIDLNISRLKGIDDTGIRPLLLGIAGFMSIFSILPFVELVIKSSQISLASSFFGQMYEIEADKAYYLFSAPAKFSFALIRHTGTMSLLLFFYLLTFEKKNTFLILGTFTSFMTMALFSILCGSRGGLIGWLCAFVFYLLLFRGSLSSGSYKVIKNISYVFLAGVVMVFIYISFSRVGYGDSYQSRSFSTDRWIAQYLGMGFLYFSDTVWNMTKFADGDQNFGLLKSWLGLYNYETYSDYISYMEKYLGVKLTEFYTFIGDIYCDLGRIGTVVYSLLFYSVSRLVCRIRSPYISVLKIFMIFMIFRFLCYGFAANLYRTIAIQKELVYPIIIGVFLLIMSNLGMNKQIQKKGDSEIAL